MLQPLKQHSFKKLFIFSIYYTNRVQTYLKNFPSRRILGRLPGVPSTGESFKNAHNSAKRQKKIKMAQGHLKWDQNELIYEKNRVQKSRETVPLLYFLYKIEEW